MPTVPVEQKNIANQTIGTTETGPTSARTTRKSTTWIGGTSRDTRWQLPSQSLDAWILTWRPRLAMMHLLLLR